MRVCDVTQRLPRVRRAISRRLDFLLAVRRARAEMPRLRLAGAQLVVQLQSLPDLVERLDDSCGVCILDINPELARLRCHRLRLNPVVSDIDRVPRRLGIR